MANDIEKLKNIVIKALEDKKAMDISLIDLKGKSDLAEYMIFASGSSSKNMRALAENVKFELRKSFDLPVHIEGLNSASWILIDLGDIIIHVFNKEAREYFKLEEKFR